MKRGPWLAGAAVAVVLGAGATAWAWQRRADPVYDDEAELVEYLVAVKEHRMLAGRLPPPRRARSWPRRKTSVRADRTERSVAATVLVTKRTLAIGGDPLPVAVFPDGLAAFAATGLPLRYKGSGPNDLYLPDLGNGLSWCEALAVVVSPDLRDRHAAAGAAAAGRDVTARRPQRDPSVVTDADRSRVRARAGRIRILPIGGAVLVTQPRLPSTPRTARSNRPNCNWPAVKITSKRTRYLLRRRARVERAVRSTRRRGRHHRHPRDVRQPVDARLLHLAHQVTGAAEHVRALLRQAEGAWARRGRPRSIDRRSGVGTVITCTRRRSSRG
jgi:hypothetical protein